MFLPSCPALWTQRRVGFLLTFALFVVMGTAFAQNGEDEVHIAPRQSPRAATEVSTSVTTQLVADVNLVLVPVTVTGPGDRPITGLEKSNFSVYEDKQELAITSFSREDAPVSLGILFDMSGSMVDKMEKAREAVVEFLKTANPSDEFFLVGFSDKAQLLSGFTRRISDAQNRLAAGNPSGRTALLDAIHMGITQMRRAKYTRKALLIISDGGDNNSLHSPGEVKEAAQEGDTQIYAIGIFDRSPGTREESEGPNLLAEFTDMAGGRTFRLENPDDLPEVAANISAELRNAYVIGYKPAALARNGKWHKIVIRLKPNGLHKFRVHARRGYFAPRE